MSVQSDPRYQVFFNAARAGVARDAFNQNLGLAAQGRQVNAAIAESEARRQFDQQQLEVQRQRAQVDAFTAQADEMNRIRDDERAMMTAQSQIQERNERDAYRDARLQQLETSMQNEKQHRERKLENEAARLEESKRASTEREDRLREQHAEEMDMRASQGEANRQAAAQRTGRTARGAMVRTILGAATRLQTTKMNVDAQEKRDAARDAANAAKRDQELDIKEGEYLADYEKQLAANLKAEPSKLDLLKWLADPRVAQDTSGANKRDLAVGLWRKELDRSAAEALKHRLEGLGREKEYNFESGKAVRQSRPVPANSQESVRRAAAQKSEAEKVALAEREADDLRRDLRQSPVDSVSDLDKVRAMFLREINSTGSVSLDLKQAAADVYGWDVVGEAQDSAGIMAVDQQQYKAYARPGESMEQYLARRHDEAAKAQKQDDLRAAQAKETERVVQLAEERFEKQIQDAMPAAREWVGKNPGKQAAMGLLEPLTDIRGFTGAWQMAGLADEVGLDTPLQERLRWMGEEGQPEREARKRALTEMLQGSVLGNIILDVANQNPNEAHDWFTTFFNVLELPGDVVYNVLAGNDRRFDSAINDRLAEMARLGVNLTADGAAGMFGKGLKASVQQIARGGAEGRAALSQVLRQGWDESALGAATKAAGAVGRATVGALDEGVEATLAARAAGIREASYPKSPVNMEAQARANARQSWMGKDATGVHPQYGQVFAGEKIPVDDPVNVDRIRQSITEVKTQEDAYRVADRIAELPSSEAKVELEEALSKASAQVQRNINDINDAALKDDAYWENEIARQEFEAERPQPGNTEGAHGDIETYFQPPLVSKTKGGPGTQPGFEGRPSKPQLISAAISKQRADEEAARAAALVRRGFDAQPGFEGKPGRASLSEMAAQKRAADDFAKQVNQERAAAAEQLRGPFIPVPMGPETPPLHGRKMLLKSVAEAQPDPKSIKPETVPNLGAEELKVADEAAEAPVSSVPGQPRSVGAAAGGIREREVNPGFEIEGYTLEDVAKLYDEDPTKLAAGQTKSLLEKIRNEVRGQVDEVMGNPKQVPKAREFIRKMQRVLLSLPATGPSVKLSVTLDSMSDLLEHGRSLNPQRTINRRFLPAIDPKDGNSIRQFYRTLDSTIAALPEPSKIGYNTVRTIGKEVDDALATLRTMKSRNPNREATIGRLETFRKALNGDSPARAVVKDATGQEWVDDAVLGYVAGGHKAQLEEIAKRTDYAEAHELLMKQGSPLMQTIRDFETAQTFTNTADDFTAPYQSARRAIQKLVEEGKPVPGTIADRLVSTAMAVRRAAEEAPDLVESRRRAVIHGTNQIIEAWREGIKKGVFEPKIISERKPTTTAIKKDVVANFENMEADLKETLQAIREFAKKGTSEGGKNLLKRVKGTGTGKGEINPGIVAGEPAALQHFREQIKTEMKQLIDRFGLGAIASAKGDKVTQRWLDSIGMKVEDFRQTPEVAPQIGPIAKAVDEVAEPKVQVGPIKAEPVKAPEAVQAEPKVTETASQVGPIKAAAPASTKVEWAKSEGGYTKSKDGRFSIRPLYAGRTRAYAYRIDDKVTKTFKTFDVGGVSGSPIQQAKAWAASKVLEEAKEAAKGIDPKKIGLPIIGATAIGTTGAAWPDVEDTEANWEFVKAAIKGAAAIGGLYLFHRLWNSRPFKYGRFDPTWNAPITPHSPVQVTARKLGPADFAPIPKGFTDTVEEFANSPSRFVPTVFHDVEPALGALEIDLGIQKARLEDGLRGIASADLEDFFRSNGASAGAVNPNDMAQRVAWMDRLISSYDPKGRTVKEAFDHVRKTSHKVPAIQIIGSRLAEAVEKFHLKPINPIIEDAVRELKKAGREDKGNHLQLWWSQRYGQNMDYDPILSKVSEGLVFSKLAGSFGTVFRNAFEPLRTAARANDPRDFAGGLAKVVANILRPSYRRGLEAAHHRFAAILQQTMMGTAGRISETARGRAFEYVMNRYGMMMLNASTYLNTAIAFETGLRMAARQGYTGVDAVKVASEFMNQSIFDMSRLDRGVGLNQSALMRTATLLQNWNVKALFSDRDLIRQMMFGSENITTYGKGKGVAGIIRRQGDQAENLKDIVPFMLTSAMFYAAGTATLGGIDWGFLRDYNPLFSNSNLSYAMEELGPATVGGTIGKAVGGLMHTATGPLVDAFVGLVRSGEAGRLSDALDIILSSTIPFDAQITRTMRYMAGYNPTVYDQMGWAGKFFTAVDEFVQGHPNADRQKVHEVLNDRERILRFFGIATQLAKKNREFQAKVNIAVEKRRALAKYGKEPEYDAEELSELVTHPAFVEGFTHMILGEDVNARSAQRLSEEDKMRLAPLLGEIQEMRK